MPRPVKGQRHPNSGRKKGVPNHKTVELMKAAEELGFDCMANWNKIFLEAKAIFEIRKKNGNLAGCLVALDRMHDVTGEVAQYIYPKKKAIEHTGEIGVKTFADFIALADKDEDDE